MCGWEFNTVLYDFDKDGGVPVNCSSCIAFLACLDWCNLMDLGFSGPPFTWARGDL